MRGFVAARNALATLSVGHQIKKLSAEIEFIKSEMEDTLVTLGSEESVTVTKCPASIVTHWAGRI